MELLSIKWLVPEDAKKPTVSCIAREIQISSSLEY